jgi:hypothetical protein
VVLSLKRYRKSLPLGCKTDKIVTSRNVLCGVGDACRASSRPMTILSDFANEIARELDARTDKPLAPHHRISFVGQRGRLDVILRGKVFASSDHLHGNENGP